MRTILLLLLSVIGVAAQTPPIEPGVSHELAKWRAARYSDVRYKLNLTLEKMSPVLKGTMEIRVNHSIMSGTELSPHYIILDWRKIRGHEKESTVSNISVNGKPATISDQPFEPRIYQTLENGAPLRYEERNEHLIFSEGVVMGENVIKLDFTSPMLTSGSAVTRYVDKEDGAEYIYSLFVPSDASTAFPVFDQPDLKARFEVAVNAPPDWSVVSNGRQWSTNHLVPVESPEREYRIVHSFNESKPISTYVFAFAAGPFESFEERPRREILDEILKEKGGLLEQDYSNPKYVNEAEIRARNIVIYVRKSQAAKFKPHAAEVFRLNREGVRYLEQYFDYKFPFPKYDLVLIPEFPFGGMEHAGATFLRESSIIFPQEPTKSDYISRANLIFHEAAHQWFGDTVTMKWFDDLWLKEGFAEFMAYKTLERVMPDANAWKVFYERNKQAAYLTDSTKGTTPIYQEIANLNSAKSAYGNIVYRKAPSFLKQAEFYLGPDKFQTSVRAFLKKHDYGNAGWEDLVEEFVAASGQDLRLWAHGWVKVRGGPRIKLWIEHYTNAPEQLRLEQYSGPFTGWRFKTKVLSVADDGQTKVYTVQSKEAGATYIPEARANNFVFVFPNYQDYGYGVFLLDAKSRDYVLKNIQNEKDAFLRSMMWGALWDSVREGELDPKEYVELAIKQLGAPLQKPARSKGSADPTESDETIIQSLLGRVSTAMSYYLSDADRTTIAPRFEAVLLDRLQNAPTPGQRITFYRAFVANASTAKGREVLKEMLRQGSGNSQAGSLRSGAPLRTKDRFDIVQRLIILGDPDALKLLAGLEKTETTDDAKRYAYAARAGIATAENKAKYWNDFVNNKEISESWIEAAFGPWNSIRHSSLTLPYLQKALQELPNHKRNRKIFFVNGWLGAFISGQRSEEALATVNKFLADNPTLDNDLRLKILENVDLIERAVKIRGKYGK